MNIKSNSYCQFCEKKCKVENGGHYFCPNGHFIVIDVSQTTQPITEVIQPKSTGSIEGISKYRLNHIKGVPCNDIGTPISKGEFCNDIGQPISEDNKHESVRPEVV